MRNAPAALLIAALAISVISTRGDHAQAQRPEERGDKAETPQEKASLWMKHKVVASQKDPRRDDPGRLRADREQCPGHAGHGLPGGLGPGRHAGIQGAVRAFEHANGAIVRNAHDENLDGVTLAYTQLAISCVQCHKLVRDNVKQ